MALAGISFAGILMFMQFGFRDGLFDASVTVHKLFDTDLVLLSPRSSSSVSMEGFPVGAWSRPWPIPTWPASRRCTGIW